MAEKKSMFSKSMNPKKWTGMDWFFAIIIIAGIGVLIAWLAGAFDSDDTRFCNSWDDHNYYTYTYSIKSNHRNTLLINKQKRNEHILV